MWRWLVAGGVLIVVGAVVLLAVTGMFFSRGGRVDERSALDTTREWARLAPYPASAKFDDIETEGSAFTREFRIRFTAPIVEVRRWLAASPGTSSVVPEVLGGGRERYDITPGGGAQFAEVIVDPSTCKVEIHTYWS